MFQDYSTGQPGGVFTHTVDTAHMMLGLAAPSAVVALGGNFEFSEDRDTPDTISILAEYPQKVTLTADATQSSPRDMVDVEFHGSAPLVTGKTKPGLSRERATPRPSRPQQEAIGLCEPRRSKAYRDLHLALSSSNQFTTTFNCATDRGRPAAFTITKRRPSGNTSKYP